MAEQKLYAVKLKDGTWWEPYATMLCMGNRRACQTELRQWRESAQYSIDAEDDYAGDNRAELKRLRGARVVPVRLVEDADGT